MKIEKLQDLKSQKGYKFNNQYFVAYEGNPNFDSSNEDYKDCIEYIKNGGIVLPEFTPQEELERAKSQKIIDLKTNFEIASKKPLPLNNVKQIDKTNKVIGVVNANYNILDANSLTDSANIIFAGTFMKMQAFLQVLCGSLKIDYNTILTQVNALSDNPATAQLANIPYTTKDTKGNEIRVLLSFKNIQEIFTHIFQRVAEKSNAFNIIEEKINKASSIEELNLIDINI